MTPLGYHAMRVAACRRALADGLRRWGVYALVAAAVVGAGASGAPAIVGAVAAWSVLPLFHALTLAPAWGVAATLAQGALGAGAVWMLRPLLLPRRWLEAERALPLATAARRRSDALLIAVVLLPLWVLQGAGAAVLLAHRPPWLQPVLAPAALIVAAMLSVVMGTALLVLRRRPLRGLSPARAPRRSRWRRWPAVLLLLPLWRGPARRSGGLLAGAAVALLLAPAVLLLWPAGGGWWLAALAAGALAASTRAATLVRDEIGPLIDACAPLPLALPALRRAAALLPLAPLLPAYAALAVVAPRARPGVLAAYVGASVVAAALPAASPVADDATRAGRWLLSLVLLLALASEVLP